LAADESYLEPAGLTGQAYVEWCVDFLSSNITLTYFGPGKEAALISKYHVLFQAIGVQVLSVADYNTLTLLHDKADFYCQLETRCSQNYGFYSCQ